MAKKKQMLLIINPRSGREKIRLKLLDILDAYTGAGYQIQVHVTQKSLDARDAVLKYGGKKDLIVCSGGDGTLNEVISGMMELTKPVALGYIPAGSTNDFASSLTDSDWDAVVEGIGVIGNSKMIIDDTPGISITELRSKCRKMKLEYGLSMVIIDYLQLMTGSGGKSSESRQQEISEISRSLKALAREINAPVIALSQLSRACETRTDHRPMLSDLRESGAIEQDADVVMFLYRDDYYNKDTDTPNIAEVIIAKQRNGPIGTVNLLWQPEFTKFVNLAK